MTDIKRVDQVPAEAVDQYIKEAYKLGEFWGDREQLKHDLGLRDVEARELHADQIDLESMTVTLTNSKQIKSAITKDANKTLAAGWLRVGRNMLRDQLLAEGESRVLATMAVKSVESDSALAEMFDDLGIPGYSDKRAAYYAENQAAARAKAIKDNKTKARTISFAKLPKTRAILIKRVNKALPDDKNTRYLFPARETGANRAQKEHAWKPISRQSSYRKIATIRERLAEWVTKQSNKVRDLFEGIRLGLHSMRKAAVQRIFKAKGIEAASKWIGHGNGKGNLATTTDYLDHSAAADRELDDVNAESLGVAA